jgi:hypothetical protein
MAESHEYIMTCLSRCFHNYPLECCSIFLSVDDIVVFSGTVNSAAMNVGVYVFI